MVVKVKKVFFTKQQTYNGSIPLLSPECNSVGTFENWEALTTILVLPLFETLFLCFVQAPVVLAYMCCLTINTISAGLFFVPKTVLSHNALWWCFAPLYFFFLTDGASLQPSARQTLMSRRLIVDARVEISFENIFCFFNLFFFESERNALNAMD